MDAKDRRARGGTRASEGLHIRTEVQRYVSSRYLPVIEHAPCHEKYIAALHGANLSLLTALDMPFLLLPFRPTSDPSAARTFIRHFFDRGQLHGEGLAQELRLTEPMVRYN